MHILLGIVYLLLGVLHVFAIQDVLAYWLALPSIICAGFALFFAYIPTVGSALAAAGTLGVWGWAWWQAGLLFVAGLAVTAALVAAFAMIEVLAEERM